MTEVCGAGGGGGTVTVGWGAWPVKGAGAGRCLCSLCSERKMRRVVHGEGGLYIFFGVYALTPLGAEASGIGSSAVIVSCKYTPLPFLAALPSSIRPTCPSSSPFSYFIGTNAVNPPLSLAEDDNTGQPVIWMFFCVTSLLLQG
jgi:hypothetical protein